MYILFQAISWGRRDDFDRWDLAIIAGLKALGLSIDREGMTKSVQSCRVSRFDENSIQNLRLNAK